MTGITVAASAAFYAQQHFKWMGGTLPVRDMPSFKPEHKEAEMKNRFNCAREAAPEDPVILNPFRHNIPATIRNAYQMPSLATDDDE